MDARKVWLGVLVAVGVVGAGVGGLAYRAPAGEPPAPEERPFVAPPKEVSSVPPPALPAPPAEPAAAPSAYRTANFRVEAPTARVARLVGEAAEQHRKAQARLWLGEELPPWPQPCRLRVKLALSGANGYTSFQFEGGQVLRREMQVEGTLERLLASVLPHEVTHTVLADQFRAPLPRWADEGAAVLAEDDEESQKYDKLMSQFLRPPGRAIPLRRLLPMRDYPKDAMVLFAEGYSVTRFLVGRKGRKTFLAFVRQGMSEGWDQAVKDHYGFPDVEALEVAWLAHQRRQARDGKAADAAKDSDAAVGPMPLTGRAVLSDGRLRVRLPLAYYQPRTSYVLEDGGKVARPVTSYALALRLQWQEHDAAQVRAFDTEGEEVSARRVAKALAREAPVLVSADGKPVSPFHLQAIKPGTLVLVLPAPVPPPAPALPPPTAVPPTAPEAPAFPPPTRAAPPVRD